MRVQLMLTCLCDAFFGEVGIATVKVLRAAGCEVSFPEAQTCCGQPPFNAGDWEASRKIANHCIASFEEGVPIVTPSGSCAAMVRDGYPMLWPEREHSECYEVGEFIVRKLGISDFGFRISENAKGAEVLERSAIRNPNSAVKVAFHRACHGRALGLTDEQETLISSLGIELIPFAQAEQCCGFGGAFSATHGKLSSGIGLEKLKNVIDAGAEVLVSGDMGCLMHLNGLIQKEKLPIKTMHYIQLIAEALPE
jgi:L-lactate dehydrogenase complex protein LldE